MTTGVKDVALVPNTAPDPFVQMIERVAVNPDVDVAKLEKLLDMQERILRHTAEAAFNAAFAEMQASLPEVAERGKTDRTHYATLEDIIQAVRPVLAAHGFALSHETEWPDDKHVRVIGILTHRAGHSRRSVFLAAADASGSKNAIQALGSSISYGRRYTTADLLNIATRKQDDDGEGSVRARQPEAPEGFDDWLADMEALADEGLPKLEEVWRGTKDDYRRYAVKFRRQEWERIKAKAGRVSKAKESARG